MSAKHYELSHLVHNVHYNVYRIYAVISITNAEYGECGSPICALFIRRSCRCRQSRNILYYVFPFQVLTFIVKMYFSSSAQLQLGSASAVRQIIKKKKKNFVSFFVLIYFIRIRSRNVCRLFSAAPEMSIKLQLNIDN